MIAGFVHLASSSPRRAALLDQIGVAFEVIAVDVDESRRSGESPGDYVRRVATEKSSRAIERLGASRRAPVIAADTAVVVGDETLGKPIDPRDALRMLALLSGRSHRVLTTVAIADGDREAAETSESRVWFRETAEDERRAYCASGEPLDKAGGYAVQGLAAVFIERIEGSYSGIMGLPVFETAALLREFGVPVLPDLSA